jgi:hypothetical protein
VSKKLFTNAHRKLSQLIQQEWGIFYLLIAKSFTSPNIDDAKELVVRL